MARSLIKLFILTLLVSGCGSSVDTPVVDASKIFTLTEKEVTGYTTAVVTLKIKGSSKLETLKSNSLIEIHRALDCSDVPLGTTQFSLFESVGMEVPLPINTVAKLFIGTSASDQCFPIVEFLPALPVLEAPLISATVPTSPSRDSTTPIITGPKPRFATSLEFFLDAACTEPAGSGLSRDFDSAGINLVVKPNVENKLYAKSTDILDRKSACKSAGAYTHDDTTPAAAIFLASTPQSPSNASYTPALIGTTDVGVTRLQLFTDIACTTILAEGSSDDFAGKGITIEVPFQSTTSVWAIAFDQAGNGSNCAFLTTFEHDIIAPTAPQYTNATPQSPTADTVLPRIRGTASADTARIKFFSNYICTDAIGVGDKSVFQSTGIQVNVMADQESSIYAQSVDYAGNASLCTHFTEYTSDLTPPPPPQLTSTLPVSPNNSSVTPKLFGSTSDDSTAVYIYRDDACTNLLASGSATEFNETGITVNLLPNTESFFYGTASDEVNNRSECVFLGLYAHSNVAPPSPTFVATSPASPSRISTTPYIKGAAHPSIAKLDFYLDNACALAVATGSRFTFVNVGISVAVDDNAETPIYTIATDEFGNQTGCIFLTNFIHTDILPRTPSFDSFDPAPPNNLTINPLIFGVAENNLLGVLPTSKIAFYDNGLCFNKIGEDDVENFRIPAGTGAYLNANANATTTVFAKTFDDAGNESNCTYLADYTHNSIPPGNPSFIAATPGSPSYSQKTFIRGAIANSTSPLPTSAVGLYSDAACSALLAAGDPTVFTSSGIQIQVARNTISQIYAQTRDVIGNVSACRLLMNFNHNDNGPIGLQASALPSGAVRLFWTADSAASPTPRYTIKRSTRSGGPYTVLATELVGSFFNDLVIKSAKRYFYTVSAYNSTGESLNSADAVVDADAVSPQAPLGLDATPGSKEVKLSWSLNTSALSYTILKSMSSGGPYSPLSKTTLGTYLDTGLTNNTSYYYVLKSNNSDGESTLSAEVSATPRDLGSPPINLTAIPVYAVSECGGGNGILLRWTPPAYYQSFVIFRDADFVSNRQIGTATANEFLDCETSADLSLRTYTVAALWGGGSTGPGAPAKFYAMSAPNLYANAGDNHILLNWNHGTNADVYRIFRTTVGLGTKSLIASTTSNQYTDNTALNGYTYAYEVEPAAIPSGSGWYSNTASATPGVNPLAPTQLSLEIGASDKPVLRWQASANANVYVIYRSAAEVGPYVQIATSTPEMYIDYSPLSGPNFYQISTKWGTFETGPTTSVGFRNSKVMSLAAVTDSDSINLTWANQVSADHFNVYRSLTADENFSLLTTVNTNAYDDIGALDNVGYYYKVVSDYADGLANVPSQTVANVRGSNVPSGLTITATSNNSISLEWTSSPSATRYYVYVATAPGGPWVASFNTTQRKGTSNGLTANTDYYLKVSALVSATETAKSDYIMARTVSTPAPPGVQAYNGNVNVTWNSIPGVNDYHVLRSVDGHTYTAVATQLATTGYNDGSVINNTEYTYKIQYNFDNFIKVSTSSAQVVPGLTLTYPSGINVSANDTGNSFEINWSEVKSRKSFNIYKSTVSGSGFALVTNTTSSSGNVMSGLSQGTTYYFKVSTLNGSLESALSPEFAAVASIIPPAPSVQVESSGGIRATWSTITGAATYDLYRSDDGGRYYAQLAAGLAALTYLDTTPVAAKVYSYRFMPKNSTGKLMNFSLKSARINTGSALLPPENVQAYLNQAASQVKLKWVPTPTALTYKIFRSGTSGSGYVLLSSISSSNTEYSDATVVAGQNYFYALKATNESGQDSAYSNEAGVSLTDAPASLTATPTNTQIELSWPAVASAAGYRILRSRQSGGPYNILESGAISTSYIDRSLSDGVTYYYVVNAVYANGAISKNSPEASATSIKKINLVSAIELLDRALASKTTVTLFDRTRTTFDPNAYDGTILYSLELVATNLDSGARSVRLVDSLNNVVDSISVPAATATPTRFEKTISLNAGFDDYRLELDGTTTGSLLSIYSVRVKVRQTGATKTKLYIPLVSSASGPSSEDGLGEVYANSTTNFSFPDEVLAYVKNTSHYSRLVQIAPWELEAIVLADVGTTGVLSFYNDSKSTSVDRTTTRFDQALPKLVNIPMENDASFFGPTNEGDNFKVGLKCSSGCGGPAQVRLYKAGLWLSLEDITKARLIQRTSLGEAALPGIQFHDSGRTKFSALDYSNPTTYFQALVIGSGTFELGLSQEGTSEANSNSKVAIANSTLNFLGGKALLTTGAISIPANSRIMPNSNSTGDAQVIQQSNLIIDVAN